MLRAVATFAGFLTCVLVSALPTAAANEDPVECITGPHIPEAFWYYLVWECTVGDTAPEPIEATTGCKFGFPITNTNCLGPI